MKVFTFKGLSQFGGPSGPQGRLKRVAQGMSGGYFVERVCLVLVIIPPLLAGSAASSRLCFSPPIRSPKTALQPRESLCQLGGRVPLAAAHHGLRPGGLSLSAKRSKNRKPVGTKREQGGSGKGFGSSKVGATLSEDLESDVDLELSGINLEEQLLDLVRVPP